MAVFKSLSVLAAFVAASSALVLPRATPTMPLSEIDNTGASPLPSPSSSPKYIALGVGFQNYTCEYSATTQTNAYVQSVLGDGALANLYDLTSILNSRDMDQITPASLKAFEACLRQTKCDPASQNDCQTCHSIAAAPIYKQQIGEHFFAPINGAQTPNFAISKTGDFLSAKKVGDVKAPANAYKGSSGAGVVDWLYLVNNGNGLSTGLSAVYRVETAGGSAPSTCSTVGQNLYVPYTAQYWLYA